MCMLVENQVVEAVQPMPATHTMRIDVVNQDGTIKRVEVDFCKSDSWFKGWNDPLSISDMFRSVFCSHIIEKDANAVGCHTTIISKLTGKPIWDVYNPYIIKPELFTNPVFNAVLKGLNNNGNS